MASIKFPRKEFEKHIKITEDIKEKINMFGTHIESLTDSEIEVEILPNRPDLLSMQGLIRALSAFIGKQTGLRKYKVTSSGEKLIVQKPLPKKWVYAYACIVRGINFDDEKIKEIIQIQEKLGATLLRNRKKGGIGIYPLNKITFPITFRGMKPDEIKFRPLEYPEIITGKQVISKHPTGREYAHLVEDWEVFPVFIDKKGIIMSMPPIINSHDVGKIDENTKEVFIECTGTDSLTIQKALIILITTLAELGGEIYSIECIQQNREKTQFPNLTPEKRKISIEDINNLLGLSLKEKDLERILPKMGFEYKKGIVSVPAWRTDILDSVDIIEDVAIAYGYNNLTPVLPLIDTVGEESNKSIIKEKISEILIGICLLEVSSYHIIKNKEAEILKEEDRVSIQNSKTDYKFLRPNLLIPSLRILRENKDNEYPQRIFEIGPVFAFDKNSQTGIKESENLIIVATPASFTEMKQILEYLMRTLGLMYKLKESSNKLLIEGRTAAIMFEDKEIGYFGEMHPETLRSHGLKLPCAMIEISLESLMNK